MFDWAMVGALAAIVGLGGTLLAWVIRVQIEAVKDSILAFKESVNERIDTLEDEMKRHEETGLRQHRENIDRFHSMRNEITPMFMLLERLKERIFGGSK